MKEKRKKRKTGKATALRRLGEDSCEWRGQLSFSSRSAGEESACAHLIHPDPLFPRRKRA
jgi:hypothetical protein